MRLGIAANGHVEHRASRGVNGIGVGWTNRGYIEGVFFVLLYPALARRMQLSLVPLVIPLQGPIQRWYLNSSMSLPSLAKIKTLHLIYEP